MRTEKHGLTMFDVYNFKIEMRIQNLDILFALQNSNNKDVKNITLTKH